ncbi:MAG: hypothetical protein K9J74_13020 [Sulfuritalea sp.]|nr:hypothetical protein [Sulfuritalea sp.]
MATSTKRTTPAKSRPPAKAPAKAPTKAPAKRSAPSKPFLRFYYPEGLRKKALALIDTIEQAEDATTHRDALSDLVMELTQSGMEYFFMKPLKLAKPGFLVEKSANLGLAGVQQVMGSVVRKIIGRMNSPQLISVCGSIRQLML